MDDKLASKIEKCAMEIASCARAHRASVDEKEMFEGKILDYFDILEELLTEGV